MFRIHSWRNIPLVALLLFSAQSAVAATPVSNLYTSYSLTNPNEISWVTCGATSVSEGCYGSGSLTKLSNACAVLEGPLQVVTNTATEYSVTRRLYVLNAGTAKNSAVLNVYKKTDTVANGYDTTTITLSTQIALPLIGGAKVTCYMAGNSAALFLGTSESTTATKVSIPSLQTSQVGGFSPPITVSQITGSADGYVAVSFGAGSDTGFIVFGPDGNGEEDGGGSAFVVNSVQGVQLTPNSAAAQTRTIAHRNFHISADAD